MFARRLIPFLLLALCGCSGTGVSPGVPPPESRLGAGDLDPAAGDGRVRVPAPPATKPFSSRVLSAIAFERTTGLAASPARILEGR